jgi:hypothetical protein
MKVTDHTRMLKRFFDNNERLQKFKKLLLENRKKFRDVTRSQEDKYEFGAHVV